jgi:hypothetical protein
MAVSSHRSATDSSGVMRISRVLDTGNQKPASLIDKDIVAAGAALDELLKTSLSAPGRPRSRSARR